MHYLWWIPMVALAYIGYAWMSKQSHDLGGIYFWLLAFVPTPFWAIVTRVSNNLIVDSLIFNLVMGVSFTIGLILLGVSSSFSIHQYIGLGLALSGLLVMKLG